MSAQRSLAWRMQEVRRWAWFHLGARMAPTNIGVAHGPEPHPDLHARCRCGRRWPEHEPVMGYCPEAA